MENHQRNLDSKEINIFIMYTSEHIVYPPAPQKKKLLHLHRHQTNDAQL